MLSKPQSTNAAPPPPPQPEPPPAIAPGTFVTFTEYVSGPESIWGKGYSQFTYRAVVLQTTGGTAQVKVNKIERAWLRRITSSGSPRGIVSCLPFTDETFDSAVCTLVFCSVTDPLRGLHEICRVLKPGGTLLMVEHVRAHGRVAAALQDMLTPFARFFAGNCHWNRDTERTVNEAGFEVIERRDLGGVMVPMVMLKAREQEGGDHRVHDDCKSHYVPCGHQTSKGKRGYWFFLCPSSL